MASKSLKNAQTPITTADKELSDSFKMARQGWDYYARQDFNNALESFLKAVQFEQENIDFQYGLALTLKLMGKGQESVHAFEKILQQIDSVGDRVKATMLQRLIQGHINHITQGNWNLGELVWQRKP